MISAKEYRFKIRAYKTVDGIQYKGRYSNELITATAPDDLKNLYVKSYGDNSTEIAWNKVDRVTGYKIYILDTNTNQYNYYGKVKGVNSANVQGLNMKDIKNVRVRAYFTSNGVQYFGKYSNNTMRSGVDVSKWQGDINWKKVRNQGVNFTIIRIGYRGYTNGKIYEDGCFKTNIENALAQNMEVGVYFYSTALNENEVVEEATWVINKLKEYNVQNKCKYIALDFEEYGVHRTENITKEQTNNNAIAFLREVQNNGFNPILYANTNYMKNIYNGNNIISKIKNCKIWLAQYNTRVTYEGKYDIWQYTSSGYLKGITGNVDLNLLYF